MNGKRVPMVPVKPRIILEPDGFSVAHFDHSLFRVRWAEVKEIATFKRDLMIVDLICLGFRISDSGEFREVHEEMQGFEELTKKLGQVFPGVRWEDWFLEVYKPAFHLKWTHIYGETLPPEKWTPMPDIKRPEAPASVGVPKALGTFFGVGLIPGPTGTYASAVTAALLYLALGLGCPLWGVLAAIVFLTAAGILVGPACIRAFKSSDPHEVVIDEVAGMMIAALPAWCPHMTHWPWATLAIAFFWFRMFDIWKPPPIRRLERLPAGWGIMADDLLAGVYALVLTLGNLYLLNRVFG